MTGNDTIRGFELLECIELQKRIEIIYTFHIQTKTNLEEDLKLALLHIRVMLSYTRFDICIDTFRFLFLRECDPSIHEQDFKRVQVRVRSIAEMDIKVLFQRVEQYFPSVEDKKHFWTIQNHWK